MAGADDVDGVEVALLDDPVGVRVDEVEAGGRAPVAQQPRLDVFELQWSIEQRVVEQIDLPDRQVVGRPPASTRRSAAARPAREDGPRGHHGPSPPSGYASRF